MKITFSFPRPRPRFVVRRFGVFYLGNVPDSWFVGTRYARVFTSWIAARAAARKLAYSKVIRVA